MSQTIQRYGRKRRRDWQSPFSWFSWYFMVEAATSTGAPDALKTETGLLLLTESGETLFTDPG